MVSGIMYWGRLMTCCIRRRCTRIHSFNTAILPEPTSSAPAGRNATCRALHRFAKCAGFLPARYTPRAMKSRIATGQREGRIEDQKTRTLEARKGAAPEN